MSREPSFPQEYPSVWTNIEVPDIYLSENGRFLIVEKFTYNRESDEYLGFEEVGAVLGKRRDTKYEGSYEQVAKVVRSFSTQPDEDLRVLFKLIVMGFLLRNGDAHMKNFGLLYRDDFSFVRLAPAYDVVCTTVYMPDDKPALFMLGTKRWHTKERLVEFGVRSCGLSEEEAREICDVCEQAVAETVREVRSYVKENREFEGIGNRMIREWESALLSFQKNPARRVRRGL